jgi:hypothetical protein
VLVRWLKWLLKPLMVILLLPVLGCGGILALLMADSAIRQIPSNVISAVREQGNLAPLPPSATDLKTYGWSSGFSSGRYIRFKAPAQEIEAFLAASPGLKGAKPEHYGPERMYLPYPKEQPRTDEGYEEYRRHQYFSLNGPEWYNPSIRMKGRLYGIPWHGPGYHGQVVIDDELHVVFVYVGYS